MFKLIIILLQALFAQEDTWIERPQTLRRNLISVRSDNSQNNNWPESDRLIKTEQSCSYHVCSECKRLYSENTIVESGNNHSNLIQEEYIPDKLNSSASLDNNTLCSQELPIIQEQKPIETPPPDDSLYAGSIFEQPLSNLEEYKPEKEQTISRGDPSLAGSIFDQPLSNLREYSANPPIKPESKISEGESKKDPAKKTTGKGNKKKSSKNCSFDIFNSKVVLFTVAIAAISLIN